MTRALMALALLLTACAPTVQETRRAVAECVASLEPADTDEWREALEGCAL